MGQPQRRGDIRLVELSEVCPECGSVNTLVVTIKSRDVVYYYRCSVCGHAWRYERLTD